MFKGSIDNYISFSQSINQEQASSVLLASTSAVVFLCFFLSSWTSRGNIPILSSDLSLRSADCDPQRAPQAAAGSRPHPTGGMWQMHGLRCACSCPGLEPEKEASRWKIREHSVVVFFFSAWMVLYYSNFQIFNLILNFHPGLLQNSLKWYPKSKKALQKKQLI